MHMNSADLAQYGNKTYLVHSDRYSNFLWIYQLKTTTTKSVIDALWHTFYLMGFPDRLRTDNGPQFISQEFLDKGFQGRREGDRTIRLEGITSGVAGEIHWAKRLGSSSMKACRTRGRQGESVGSVPRSPSTSGSSRARQTAS